MNRVHDPFSNLQVLFIYFYSRLKKERISVFVTVTVTLLFNRKLLHTFEILTEAYFCEFVQQIAVQTNQLVSLWLFLRFVNGAILSEERGATQVTSQ